jgi:hypothetical protein
MAVTFGPIGPAPARDIFVFDFTQQVGTTGSITAAQWTCGLDAATLITDPDPTTHIIGAPTYDRYHTSALCGDMLQGVIYELQTVVTIDDGRIFTRTAELLCTSEVGAIIVDVDGAIRFDFNEWVTRFPEFANLDPDQAHEYWDQACTMFRNDASSPEQDLTQRRTILDVLTAHFAALFALPPIGRGGVNAMVGVYTSKSVNGVSLGNSGLLPGFSGTRAWLATTQYGLKYLALTAGYRAFHYVQGPQRYPYPPNVPWPPYGYLPFWPWRG